MQQKSELPEGWAWTNIGQTIDSMKNGIYKPSKFYIDDGIACLRMYNIDQGKIIWKDIKRMDLTQKEINDYLLEPGDLLINRVNSRELVGKAAVIPDGIETCVFESKNIRVKVNKNMINPYYLSYYFTLYGSEYFNQNSQQVVGMASISQPQIAEFPLPLPLLSEQHRIISAIEALFARLDATNEKLDRVPEILKKFRESVLAAACEGRLTESWRKENPDVETIYLLLKTIKNDKLTSGKEKKDQIKNDDVISGDEISFSVPFSWKCVKLGDLCKFIDYRGKTPKKTESGVRLITAKNVKMGNLSEEPKEFIAIEDYDKWMTRGFPEYGDVLFTTEGPLGNVAQLNVAEKVALAQRIITLQPYGKISKSFIKFALMSPQIQSQIHSKSTGTTVKGIKAAIFKLILVPIPPLPEQHEIVRRVDALFSFASSIEAKVAAAREKTEKLRQSILAKAFSGELVETEAEIARREGRDYETAEILLERIKEERGKGGKKR